MGTKRIPPMIVCPYCGPEHVMYAGRVLSIICTECLDLLRKHGGDGRLTTQIRLVKGLDPTDETPQADSE